MAIFEVTIIYVRILINKRLDNLYIKGLYCTHKDVQSLIALHTQLFIMWLRYDVIGKKYLFYCFSKLNNSC